MMNIAPTSYTAEKKTSILGTLIRKIDWVLLVATAFLVVLGFVLLYSATVRFENPVAYLSRQFGALLVGLFVIILVMIIDYEFHRTYSYYIYALSIILLVSVLIFGTTLKGTKAWLNIGYFSVQMSEITKIIFILTLAGYLDREWRELYRLQKLMVPLLLLGGNVFLIILEHDFGGSLVYYPVFLAMLFFANVRIIHIMGIALLGAVTLGNPLLKTILAANAKTVFLAKFLGPKVYITLILIAALIFLMWWLLNQFRIFIPIFYFACTFAIILLGTFSSYFIDMNLKEYQKKRLIVFVSPSVDPLGAGYNINQSRIAVGSGKIFGKGLLHGKQVQLGYVPEKHTDFVFSLLGEEMGFVVSSLVVCLYLVIVWRSINIAKVARNRFGSLVAAGIGTMFAFYSLVNIGMTIGLMPITGLPLPFLSYGGSCLVSSLSAVGLLLSIHIRRYIY